LPNLPSTIPAAKAALVTLITGATYPTLPSGETVQVSYGEPKDRGRLAVIVGDTSGTGEADQEWAALGANNRDEHYALGLNVIVNVPGQSQQVSTELAFAVFAAIENALRDDPTLVTIGVDASYFSVQIRQPVHVEEATTEGFLTEVISAVRCVARI
jgi:hypothetical protein